MTLRLTASGCRTALGDADQTCAELLAGRVALQALPVGAAWAAIGCRWP